MFLLSKIRSTKTISHMKMIQISVKAERSKYFSDLSCCLTSTRSISKFSFKKSHAWIITEKGLKNRANRKASQRTIGNGPYTSLKSFKT